MNYSWIAGNFNSDLALANPPTTNSSTTVQTVNDQIARSCSATVKLSNNQPESVFSTNIPSANSQQTCPSTTIKSVNDQITANLTTPQLSSLPPTPSVSAILRHSIFFYIFTKLYVSPIFS